MVKAIHSGYIHYIIEIESDWFELTLLIQCILAHWFTHTHTYIHSHIYTQVKLLHSVVWTLTYK